ncbi:MAG: hypothetical protein HY951_15150 [Bacteroidia bacterium]|nr:hypothetical protein [Bacteroidia bacterium]
MNLLFVIILVIVTGGIVFFTVFYVLKMFLDNENKRRIHETDKQNLKLITPVRLQAYERIILFLERISPNSLIVRLQAPGMQSLQLQMEMLSLIRAEFEHNLSQQIYMSDRAWEVANSAKENVIKLINISAENVDKDAPAIELTKQIMEQWVNTNPSPVKTAIVYIKNEVYTLFYK